MSTPAPRAPDEGPPASGNALPDEDALIAAMDRALALARAGTGATGANPCVGAVVLDAAGNQVGAGRSEPAGGRHAEVVALAAAGEAARGGTVVTTLEPCDATGRTGPCTAALLAAGIARSVYALADPLPPFAGGGARLAAAGVEVRAGLAAAAAEEIHRPWLTAVRRGSPFVTVKIAASLDGRSAAADGSSRWITAPAARADAHALRGRVGAILVGSGTVLADDPALTVRDQPEPRTPLRVVLDRRARVPPGARVFDDAAPSRHVTDERPLPALLTDLFTGGVRHVLVEGGPTLAGAVLAAGLADELVVYLAPAILGAGTAAVQTPLLPGIDHALRWRYADVRPLGPDLRLTAVPLGPAAPEGDG